MNRMGWLLIGLGALLLLTHGGFGFFFFPMIFPALLLWMLFFGFFGRGRGLYRYGWAGPRVGCSAREPHMEHGEPRTEVKTEERSYTGETTQL